MTLHLTSPYLTKHPYTEQVGEKPTRHFPNTSKGLTPMAMNNLLKPESGFHARPDGTGDEYGFFSWDAFKCQFLQYLEQSTLSLTGHGAYTPTTPGGRLFNFFYCLFALLLVSTYTANLASFLSYEQPFSDIESIGHLATTEKRVCVPDGTAMTDWIRSSYRRMNVVLKQGTTGMIEGLSTGDCEYYIDTAPEIDYQVNNRCVDNVQSVGTPLQFGYTDMAVGVAKNRTDIVETLNYWLAALKQCSTTDTVNYPLCYNALNMDGLYQKHIKTRNCEMEADEEEEFKRFSFLDFGVIFGVLWTIYILTVCYELFHNRQLLGMRISESHDFWNWLVTNYGDDYFDDDQLLVDDFMDNVWESQKFNGEWMAECMERVQHHYLRTDVNTWRVLTLTLKRLLRNQSLCSKMRKEGKDLKNKDYVLALVIKCQDTLEILVRRAIVETSEDYTMRQIERELCSQEHKYAHKRVDRHHNIFSAFLRNSESFGEAVKDRVNSVMQDEEKVMMRELRRSSHSRLRASITETGTDLSRYDHQQSFRLSRSSIAEIDKDVEMQLQNLEKKKSKPFEDVIKLFDLSKINFGKGNQNPKVSEE